MFGKNNTTRIFIDKDRVIHEGHAAERLLEERKAKYENDIDPTLGIVRVSQEQWEEAQIYERNTWMTHRGAFTDRNEHHRERFANYSILEGVHFKQGIELGCGPFTNMRFIAEVCKIDSIYLLDPLIQDYVEHPACRYRRGRFGGILNRSLITGDLKSPFNLWKNLENQYRIGGLYGRNVQTIASTIEDFSDQHQFDLVVMINVLEHCRDANLVLGQVSRLLVPGGTLVFQDKLYEPEETENLLESMYDVGHPLRVSGYTVNSYIETNYVSQMKSVFSVKRSFQGIHWQESELYFIGQKRSSG